MVHRLLQQTKTPASEIFDRIGRFQGYLKELGIELALLRQNADLYYFTGTVQDGHLFIPAQGEPLFLVWRAFERAVEEAALGRKYIEPLPGLSSLKGILKAKGLGDPETIGLELDCLPASLYLYYSQKLWPSAKFLDATHAIRITRAIKSPWEIERIKGACNQAATVTALVPGMLRSDIGELELAAQIEAVMRRLGHPGYIRMRGWNQECGIGQILSGPEGAMPSWTNTPGGGAGTSPAYGQGAGWRTIRPHEPVSVDVGGSINGYLCDQTRLFCINGLPSRLLDAYDAVLEVHYGIEERLVPGAACSSIYEWALDRMDALGYGQNFMGTGRNRVVFVGHGLGIEIDEYPFISRDNNMILSQGMVVAVEPKLIFGSYGLIGIEDTYLITDKGAERLTVSPQGLVVV